MASPLTATEKLQGMARERWGSATAFRIGYLASEIGSIEGSVNPYLLGSRAHRMFQEGLDAGKNERLKGTTPPLASELAALAGQPAAQQGSTDTGSTP